MQTLPSTLVPAGAPAGALLWPVILSGGAGTRLWPRSRAALPKQFLSLVSEHTLLQDTALRLADSPLAGDPLVVCNDEHRFLLAEQLRRVGVRPRAVFLEPVARNTAPAIAVAAFAAADADPDTLLLVLPSDHLIGDRVAFHLAVERALPAARAGHLVTFGVRPSAPETGYGYIQAGAALDANGACLAVTRFVEKPDLATALEYLRTGGYLWNSGMFLFKAGAFLAELLRLRPALHEASHRAWAQRTGDLDFQRLDPAAFAACPAESIDNAVMEHTRKAAVVPADIGWSDVGSWNSLWEAQPKDPDGNVMKGDVIADASRNLLVSAESRLVVAIGVEELVIVETPDAVLVTHRDRTQQVKQMVERLATAGREEHLTHRKAFRPWGHYESIDGGKRFQVKRITVNPGGQLSLQMHHHRAEHWIVVSGTAKITRGDETLLLTENQSTYIPLGVTHRLENPGRIPLELIEVQSGAYLGEDDIVRFEDSYNRR